MARNRFAPLRRVTLVSAKVTKAIAPGWAPAGFPPSGAAPPGRADGPSLARRRWLGVLPRSPAPRHLHSACTNVAVGGVWTGVVRNEEIQDLWELIGRRSYTGGAGGAERDLCRPSGGVAQGETSHGWRVSAAGPGTAHRRAPPEQRRSEGTRRAGTRSNGFSPLFAETKRGSP
jgi:hypothetical protein